MEKKIGAIFMMNVGDDDTHHYASAASPAVMMIIVTLRPLRVKSGHDDAGERRDNILLIIITMHPQPESSYRQVSGGQNLPRPA